MDLKEMREQAFKEMRTLGKKVDAGLAKDADFDRINVLAEDIKGYDMKLASADRMESFLNGEAPSSGDGQSRFVKRDRPALKHMASTVLQKLQSKELLTGSSEAIPDQFIDSPVLLPAQSSWDVSQLFPVHVIEKSVYQYLRQVSREQNAAVVAPGDVKPTSEYGFETVKGQLAVVAHLSEPIHTYWAKDFPEAVVGATEELLRGLMDAQERYLINGTGQDGEPAGLLNTSGVQVQEFDTDMLTSTRAAITSLEVLGLDANAFVLHPSDWQAIELTRDATGRLEFSAGPVDRAEKRLWGVRVATSTHVAAGTGLLVDAGAAHILSDGQTFVEAGASNDDFTRNQLRLRAEQRLGVAVTNPAGVVSIELAAGTEA